MVAFSKNQLPKIFAKLTPSGTPIIAIIVTMFGAIPDCFQNNLRQKQFLKFVGCCCFTMVVVWIAICISQFNFRRQWYKSGKTVKDLRFAAPLFPLTPIVGGLFCIVTCISMVFDPSMQVGFICCIIFILLCYVSYFIFYRKKI